MNHPKLVLPEDPNRELFPESVVNIVLAGQQYHARIERNFDGIPEIRAVRDNSRLAREGEGENRLHEWFEVSDIGYGRSVHIDVVERDHLYGVRLPGDQAIYTNIPKPNSSLTDIARDLDG
jgi:hypothetical protein